ncbi:regulator of chromosome condensation, putative [Plasmodium malariae]|uniref:Regulator of chromosome condensation, putative n=1 Tax=Plasmodium malariae TaxID=5858 RepID=A0A1C3KCZ4_PLAMA|nr:regulator of chromosome condensation, putative [Plasmodium malariae]
MGQGNGKSRLIVYGTNEYLIDSKKEFCLLNIRNSVRIKNIYSGPNNIIIIYENDDFEIVGLNNCGQLGLGDKVNRNKLTINPIMSKQKIRKISCGHEHVIALLYNHNIFVWGNNQYGQLGIGNNTEEISTPLLIFFNEKVIDIACGKNHSIFLTEYEDINVNTYSNDAKVKKDGPDYRNSGITKEKKKLRTNCLHEFDININDGISSTLKWELIEKGVLGSGNENNPERVRMEEEMEYEEEEEEEEEEKAEDEEEEEAEVKVEVEDEEEGEEEDLDDNDEEEANDQKNKTTSNEEINSKMKISSNEKTSSKAKSSPTSNINFSIYACGSGARGKLGFKNEENVYFPKKIEIKKKLKVKSIYSSYNHNALLTKQGRLYTWGYNKSGDLGINNKKSSYKIKKLKFINDIIIKVSLGKLYSACLTKNNIFYVWGNNIDGIKNMNLSNFRIKEFSCNEDNIIILTEDNNLFLLDSSKRVQYMNKLILTKLLSGLKSNVNYIQYNFIGNGFNYIYAYISINKEIKTKNDFKKINHNEKCNFAQINNATIEKAKKETIIFLDKNELTHLTVMQEKKNCVETSKCAPLYNNNYNNNPNILNNIGTDVIIDEWDEQDEGITSLGVLCNKTQEGNENGDVGDDLCTTNEEKREGEKRMEQRKEKIENEEDEEVRKDKPYDVMENTFIGCELRGDAFIVSETGNSFTNNEFRNDGHGFEFDKIQLKHERHANLPSLKVDNGRNFLRSIDKFGKNINKLKKHSSYTNDSKKGMESNTTSGNSIYAEKKGDDKTKSNKYKFHNLGNTPIELITQNNKKDLNNVNNIEYIINNINYINLDMINVEDVSIDNEFLQKQINHSTNNNTNYIDYLNIDSELISKCDVLGIMGKNFHHSISENKYINLNIILLNELKKQKKINIVYGHLLGKLLNELNLLRNENKNISSRENL